MNFKKYKLVIFDLDNTLYDESIYLMKAYEEISSYLSEKYCRLSYLEIESFLRNEFLKNGRGLLFNRLFDKFAIKNELVKCLEILRTVKFNEKISLSRKAGSLLKRALDESQVIILTNGNPEQQRNKIEQINWEGNLEYLEVIYANQFSPKPSGKAYFEFIEKKFGTSAENILMIGDHVSDEVFAENINCDFIDINRLIF